MHICCRGFITSGWWREAKHLHHAWPSAATAVAAAEPGWPRDLFPGAGPMEREALEAVAPYFLPQRSQSVTKKWSQLAGESHRKSPNSINFWFYLFPSSSCHFPQFKSLDFPLVLRCSGFFQPISPFCLAELGFSHLHLKEFWLIRLLSVRWIHKSDIKNTKRYKRLFRLYTVWFKTLLIILETLFQSKW